MKDNTIVHGQQTVHWCEVLVEKPMQAGRRFEMWNSDPGGTGSASLRKVGMVDDIIEAEKYDTT